MKRSLKYTLNEIAEHFATDGWPLNLNLYALIYKINTKKLSDALIASGYKLKTTPDMVKILAPDSKKVSKPLAQASLLKKQAKPSQKRAELNKAVKKAKKLLAKKGS
jgi:hypothetical protein